MKWVVVVFVRRPRMSRLRGPALFVCLETERERKCERAREKWRKREEREYVRKKERQFNHHLHTTNRFPQPSLAEQDRE